MHHGGRLRQKAGRGGHAGSAGLCDQGDLRRDNANCVVWAGKYPAEINHLITLNLFTTITNANFDNESIEARIRATLACQGGAACPAALIRTALPEAALWDGTGDWQQKAAAVGVLATENEDIRSLRELITYGLKGLSAYSKHANALLQEDGEIDAFLAAGTGGHAG